MAATTRGEATTSSSVAACSAVKIYGNFPSLALGGPNDANTRGTLIPTTGVDQYGSTLAQWFGVSQANLPTVFPNIGNYPANKLGFLG